MTQQQMAILMGVAQRTISRWERGEDNPCPAQQKRIRDLGWEPPGSLMYGLALSVRHCPAPRALSRTQKLQLQALSMPALKKRPSIKDWIGSDLAPIAAGVLREMLDDRALQKAIANREIAAVVSTTGSVLDTEESDRVRNFRTTINYFFHEDTVYSDAISVPVGANEPHGYTAISMDEAGASQLIEPMPIEWPSADENEGSPASRGLRGRATHQRQKTGRRRSR